jgi:predicted transcriptional regulator
MKYRSRSEIISMILDSMSSGHATKTKIMYKAYLSYMQLKEYLSFLEETKLIQYDSETGGYGLTDKGRKLMRLYEKIGDMASQREDGSMNVLI